MATPNHPRGQHMSKQLDLVKAMFPDSKMEYELDDDGNVIKLDLSWNELQELPKEIVLLTNLQKLYLGWNKLLKIPPEIGQLMKLEELDLRCNGLKELPQKIGLLKKIYLGVGTGYYRR